MSFATTAAAPPHHDDPPDNEDSLFSNADPIEEIERFARLGRFYLDTAMRRYDQMIKLMNRRRASTSLH